MRRLWLACALATGLVLPIASQAAAESRCIGGRVGTGNDAATAVVCQYQSIGADRYAVTSVNDWTIVVKRGSTVVQTISGGPSRATTAPAGDLLARAGDAVMVSVKPTCAPSVCVVAISYAVGSAPVQVDS